MRELAPYVLVALCACVAIADYLPVLDAPFVFDDTLYISTNSRLAGLHLSELWRLFAQPYNDMGEFLPLREISYWLELSLFGPNPAAFRIDNIVLYLLCLPLVYALTAWSWRYFRPADPAASVAWASAAVTALFALHPSHVEAVVWIAGRKDVMSGLLALLALWLALSARREQGLSARHAGAALLILFAALLSKAFAVAMAAIIAMVWLMFWREMAAPKQYRLQLLWPAAALLLAAGVAKIFAASTSAVLPFYFGAEAATRSLAVLGWLVRLAVSPEHRHFFYPVFDDSYLPAMVALGAVALVGAAAGIVMLWRRRSLVGFSAVIFLLLCMPALQLLPYMQPSVVSDRYLFLAVWPAAMIIVALLWRINRVPRIALLLIIALSWAVQSAERSRDWRSTEAMEDVDVRAFPGYYVPAVYRIAAQLQHGQHDAALGMANRIAMPQLRELMIRTVDADRAVQVAIQIGMPQQAMDLLWPLSEELMRPAAEEKWNSHLANVRVARRTLIKAAWGRLIEHFPGDASVRYNAGLWMLEMLDEDAIGNLRTAVESDGLPPAVRGTAYKNYGLALLGGGRIAEAEAPLRAALEQNPPDLRAYCALVEVYRRAGRNVEAAQAEANCTSRTRLQAVVR
ncbi:MAG: hypothetical protein HYZ46_07425 [Nitrosomonadales bacterium]|nr:hypothetical protein [Nitrosomonadales bacterium]